jgi:hypothetical protein
MPILTNPVRKAEMQTLTKENDIIAKEFGDAIGTNDQVYAKQLQEKLDAQSKKFSFILDAQNREVDSTMKNMCAHDVNDAIRFSVNLFSQWTSTSTIPNGQIAGYPSFKTIGGVDERTWVG